MVNYVSRRSGAAANASVGFAVVEVAAAVEVYRLVCVPKYVRLIRSSMFSKHFVCDSAHRPIDG